MTNRTNPFLSPLVAATLLLVLLAACGHTAPATGPVASVPPTAAPTATPLAMPAAVTPSPPAPACMNGEGVVFTVPVGPDGVQYGAEQTGPMALAVAADGTFWIADTQGNRLVHYDPQGVLLNRIDLNGHGIGVADVEVIGSDVNALVVGYGEKVLRFTADGSLLATYDIPEGLGSEGGLTGLAVGDHGEVLLEFMMGAEVAQLADAQGALKPVPLSGYTREGKLYKVRQSGSWTSQGIIVAGSARIEVTAPNILAGLRILGFTPAGNFYVVVDEMVSTPTVWVDKTVHLYDPAGELLGVARVPVAGQYTYVQNGLAVGPDGCIYALLTHPERVEVVRLGFSTELEPILPTPVRYGALTRPCEVNDHDQKLDCVATDTPGDTAYKLRCRGLGAGS